ncbi:nucleotide sugar dehydrogenase [Gorillibacterium sp. sgz5001074]|uniref:nucleotide sugar dehydrogenase n=1 Tax=Gorillibacterium sp. sgz5001074 TaxID=3446695 RepID=UPI003F676C39
MNRTIGIVGLGYVGLPVAVAFGQRQRVLGFDTNPRRIDTLMKFEDYTGEVTSDELKSSQIDFTSDASRLSECNFIIVAVPTPIDQAKKPDLVPLVKASETVGRNMKKGAIVVYESTVYPGTTEEICVPVLEKYSGLKCGEDFFVGYSPERINPGDKEHTFTKIRKVVSGQNEDIANIVADVYGSVIDAGVYRAPSIKVAEAAKVIENTQRDINIAFMNELAIIFNLLDIDTKEVLAAAGTKWNFLNFTPGLVGGHCIGVDPYYLTYKAESIGYHPEVILAGRKINDGMGIFVATSIIKKMIAAGYNLQNSIVTVLGITFKENVPDIRNSKIVDIINELKDFGVKLQVTDCLADHAETEEEYGIQLVPFEALEKSDCILLAVPHKQYVELGWDGMQKLLKNETGVVGDIKSILGKEPPNNITLWRL